MNLLTWAIWLTEIFNNIHNDAGFFGCFLLLIWCLWMIIKIIAWAHDVHVKKPPGYMYIIFIICLIFTDIVPSRQTMIMMISSEAAGRIVTSEKFNSTIDPAVDYINTWITKQKDELLKADKK